MIALAILLALVTGSAGLVYVAASLYFNYKERKWEESMRDLVASPPTEEEKAIGDEWKAVEESVDNPARIPPLDRAELRDHMAARAVAELEEFEGKAPDGFETSTKHTAADQLAELIEALKPRLPENEHKKFSDALHKAQQILEEEAADEEFYQQAVAEAAAGPLPMELPELPAEVQHAGPFGCDIVFVDPPKKRVRKAKPVKKIKKKPAKKKR